MKNLPQDFEFGYFKFHKIQKEEIIFYLERYDRILILNKYDYVNAIKDVDLIHRGYLFIKQPKTLQEVFQSFVWEMKKEKLYSSYEFGMDSLVFYVGILQNK